MATVYRDIDSSAKEYFKDPHKFPGFCERFLKILPVSGGRLVPFRFNIIQRFVWEEFLLPDLLAGKPVRILCLKARQFGMSTLAEALGFWCTLGHSNWNSIVVAHKGDKSKEIFRMMKRFLKNLPSDGKTLPRFAVCRDSLGVLEFNLPPTADESNARKKFDIVLDSRIDVMSARDRDDLGRSGTYQFAHLSEAAKWPSLHGSLSSLLQACHDEPGTIVFVETTANGYNDFYDIWTDVSDSYSESMWTRVFLPWYWYSLYEKDAVEDLRFEFSDEYEQMLFNKIKEDEKLIKLNGGELPEYRIYAKLLWRRFVLKNKFKGSTEDFKQEFPATPTEAFKFSGVSAFTDISIERSCITKDPIWIGNVDVVDFRRVEADLPLEECVNTYKHPNGRLRIFEKPQEGDSYLIAADLAEGRGTEGYAESKSERDFSCIQILKLTDFPPLKQVAVWHGNIDVDSIGYLSVCLARHYNNAYLSWETNSFAMAMSIVVVKRCRYKNTIQREVRDKFTDKILWLPGWETNGTTKPSMVVIGRMFMRDGLIEIYDEQTKMELKAFGDYGGGKFRATTGHDDRVMALLQGIVLAEPRVDMEVRMKKRAELEKKENEESEYIKKHWKNNDEEEVYNPILGNDW